MPPRASPLPLLLAALLTITCAPRVAPAVSKPAPGAASTPGEPAHPPNVKPRTATPPKPLEAAPSDDEICKADGFDFVFAVEEHDGRREVQCGVGPGTACTDERMNYCEDSRLLYCVSGKLHMLDCQMTCREVGDMATGVTHDDGTCAAKDGQYMCTCCDFGEPGCPRGKSNKANGSHIQPLTPPLPSAQAPP